MSYTTHGHHISGTNTEPRPCSVARCGGIGLCLSCSRQAALFEPGPFPLRMHAAGELILEGADVIGTYKVVRSEETGELTLEFTISAELAQHIVKNAVNGLSVNIVPPEPSLEVPKPLLHHPV